VELIPDQRQNVDEDVFESDYSGELRRLETLNNNDFDMDDYDLEASEDVNEHPVTTLAAERLFGGEDNFQTYVREQQESMTNITDTLPEASHNHSRRCQVWRWRPRSSRRDKLYLHVLG
jgi:hypothetical protein